MKKLLTLLLLAISSVAWAAPALVQNTTQAGFLTSPTITLSGVAAGNLLVLCLGGNGTSVTSVVDSSGNTVSTGVAMSGSPRGAGIYYVANTSSGSHTLTVTFSGSSPNELLMVGEYSGAATTAPLDQASTIATGTGNALTSPSITPSVNGELLSACAIQATAGDAFSGWTNSFTQIATITTSDSGAWAYQVQTTAAAITAGVNANGNTNWAIGVVSFKAASGGSSAPPPQPSPFVLGAKLWRYQPLWQRPVSLEAMAR